MCSGNLVLAECILKNYSESASMVPVASKYMETATRKVKRAIPIHALRQHHRLPRPLATIVVVVGEVAEVT